MLNKGAGKLSRRDFLKSAAVLTATLVATPSVLAGCGESESTETAAEGEYTVKMGYYDCDHMIPACVSKDAGIYDALGLKVEVSKGSSVMTALAAGQLDFGYVWPEGIESAVRKGAKFFMAACNHQWGSYYLYASKDIKDAKELVGKRVGISSTMDKTDLYWCTWADKLGIPRDPKQYQAFGGMTDANEYLAMSIGELDAAVC